MTRARAWPALLALALAALPALAGEPQRAWQPPPPARLPPPGSERVELHVRFPPWQFTGTFRLEGPGGVLLDEGVARDAGALTLGDQGVERVLEGARGTLRLRVAGGLKGAAFPAVLGRWTVVGGTGAWAGLAGQGTFTACSSGDPTGSPFELQTLVGHVTGRARR